MKQIELTQGKVALVDDEDYETLNQFNWYAHKQKSGGRFYAVRKITINGKQKTISMHRFLLDALDSKLETDHIDKNGLNNQKANLRLCSVSDNQKNKCSRGTSKYIGVHYNKRSKKWMSEINVDGKRIKLGSFLNEKDAAIARDKVAKETKNEFYTLNF